MPLPTHLEPKTMEINADDIDGTISAARVVFKPRSLITVPLDNAIVLPVPVEVVLDGSGSATVDLASTNDPHAAPLNFVYDVEIANRRGEQLITGELQVPYDAVEPLNFAELLTTSVTAPNASYVLISQLVAQVALALSQEPITNGAIDDRIALATILASQISGVLVDGNIPPAIARDTEVTAAIAAALLSLDGSNITTGTVADARIAPTIARDSEVTAQLASYVLSSLLGAASGVATLTAGSVLTTSQIPNIDGAKITTGSVAAARIADLSATYLALTGAQAAAGVKTFSSKPIFSAGINTASIDAGTWTALTGTYVNGYGAYAGSTYYTPAFRIEHGTAGDLIRLRGRITTDSSMTAAENILTGLPAAARPTRNVMLAALVGSGDNTGIEITSAGTIINSWNNTSSFFSIDGLTYYIGAN